MKVLQMALDGNVICNCGIFHIADYEFLKVREKTTE